jgi:ABC-type glutathione transport system ATPase component
MPLLEVENLSVEFVAEDGTALRAVDGLSFALARGEALGIVGESGCGKTTAMLALLRLLPVSGRARARRASRARTCWRSTRAASASAAGATCRSCSRGP